MKAALFGTGSIGQRHLRNLRTLCPEMEFIFVRADERHDALSHQYAAQVVRNVEATIALKPALAIVATPSHAHAEVLAPLLNAGIACYVEKPAVITQHDVEQLRRVLDHLQPPPPTVSGCNLRFLPSLQKLRNVLQQGLIGRPIRAHLQVGQWLPDWRPQQDYRASYSADPTRGGGVAFDLIHELDMARWLFGDFDQCTAVGGHYSRLEIASEDAAAIVLGRAGGPAVSVGLDYIARPPIRRYEIFGEEGTLVWDLFGRTLQHQDSHGAHHINCGDTGFDTAQTYLIAMQTLLAASPSNSPCFYDLREGLRSAELAIRVTSQLRHTPHLTKAQVI